MIRRILATLALITMSTSANAGVLLTYGIDPDHQQIMDSLIARNVHVGVNEHDECKSESTVRGLYSAINGKPYVHVCQKWLNDAVPVEWSEYDLYALRHEAYHYVQDCKDGSINMQLQRINGSDQDLVHMVHQLGPLADKIRRIYSGKYNVSDHIMEIELEAHWAAYRLSPSNITSLINKYCKAP